MIQMVRNLYLELLDDISQHFRKVEPNIKKVDIYGYKSKNSSSIKTIE